MDKLLTSKNLFLALKILIVLLLIGFILSFGKIIILIVGLTIGYYLATITQKLKNTTFTSIIVKVTNWWSKLKAKIR